MPRLTNQTAAEKISEITDGEMFSVKFLKRTTGEERTMLCRKGVTKGVVGGDVGFDPKRHNICVVFDVGLYNESVSAFKLANGRPPNEIEQGELAHDCYRNINLESIISLKVGGTLFQVNDFPIKQWTASWPLGRRMTQTLRVSARTEEEAWTTVKRQSGLGRKPKGFTLKLNG